MLNDMSKVTHPYLENVIYWTIWNGTCHREDMMIWSDYGTKETGKGLYQKFIWEVAFGEPDSTNQVAFENFKKKNVPDHPTWTFQQNKSWRSFFSRNDRPIWFRFYSEVIYVDRPLWLQYGSLPSTSQVFFSNSTKGDQILVPCMYENATIIRIVSI